MTRNNDSFVSKLFLATKYKCRPLSGVLVHRPRPSRAVEQSNRARSTYLPRSEPLPVVDAVVDLAEPELLEEGVLGLTHEHAHPPPRVDVEQLHRGQAGMLLLLLLLGERGETGRGRGVEVGGRGRGGGCRSASGGAQGGQERVTSRRGRRSGHGHAECRIGLRGKRCRLPPPLRFLSPPASLDLFSGFSRSAFGVVCCYGFGFDDDDSRMDEKGSDCRVGAGCRWVTVQYCRRRRRIGCSFLGCWRCCRQARYTASDSRLSPFSPSEGQLPGTGEEIIRPTCNPLALRLCQPCIIRIQLNANH